MASIQSLLLKSWLRRQKLFSGGSQDPIELRLRIEHVGNIVRPHKSVHIVPVNADSVPSEWLFPEGAPQDRILLYLHGGAWFMGSTNTHRAFVSYLSHASRVRVLSINYRLAPENPFPAGLDDCIIAYEWLMQAGITADKIVVAGDSAGGNLALALLVALRDASKPLPSGAVALSPATDLAFTGESIRNRLHLDPIFSHGGPTSIIKDYITDHDPCEPLISPLYADLHGLPPIMIHVGDHEILLDDAVRFAIRAKAAGVDAQTVIWPEMFHVFPIFTPLLPEARRAVDQIASFIRSRLDIDRNTRAIS